LPPELASAGGDDKTANQSSGWFASYASMTSKVVENIQLNVKNVHVRLEDSHSLGRGRSFGCGIKIARLSVQTTTKQWVSIRCR